MGYSGQELVEQEKCKLIYANFFDGVQCFDAAKGWLQLSTPDYDQNVYDAQTKTLTTKTFSVKPVTPVDLPNLQKPIIYVSVAIEVTGLEVTLTADQYSKTRVIPVYYLDECPSYSWTDDFKICIDAYQDQVVTSVSLFSGSISFINNSIIKYTDTSGVSKLYSLKDISGEVITFEPDLLPAAQYYFPLAYYVEDIPIAAERSIVHKYNYSKEYVTTTRSLYPCGGVLDPDADLDTIINSIFSSVISYKDGTINDWEFTVTIFRSNYTLATNHLITDVLFFDTETGIYSTKQYDFEFFDKSDAAIDLETAIDQNNPSYMELIQQLGTANCSGYFKIYVDTIYQIDKDKVVNSYSYPICDGSMYDLDTCGCKGVSPCLTKIIYPCEDCDPVTGEITKNCVDPHEKCTILGCKQDYTDSACICNSNTYGYTTFPNITVAFDTIICKSESYASYRLYPNGDIQASMGNITQARNLPKLGLANIYDYITPNRYNYGGRVRSVSVRAFLLMNYLDVTHEELEDKLNYRYINLTASEVLKICPGIGGITVDWFNGTTHNSRGAFTSIGYPCGYTKATLKFSRDGTIKTYYWTKKGFNFVYPDILNYTSVTDNTTIQTAYNAYCDKVKFLGSDKAYTYGRYLEEREAGTGVPATTPLVIDPSA